MSSVKSYFDDHSHHHAYHREPFTYAQVVDHVKKTLTSSSLKILDLGCGDGSFIKALQSFGVRGKLYGVDLSHSMVAQGMKDLRVNCDLLVADGFQLPFKGDIMFDLIHLDSVLHHLIGRNRKESRKLAENLLGLLYEKLVPNGVIIVEEMFYNSYIFTEFTSIMIFYGLKTLKKSRLDFSKIRNEFQPGLEVNFFSEVGLKTLFSKYSHDFLSLNRVPDRVPKFYRCFLLKEFGKISYAIH